MSIEPILAGKPIDTTTECASLFALGQEWVILGRRDGHIADRKPAAWEYTFPEASKVFERMRDAGDITTTLRTDRSGTSTLFGKLAQPVVATGRRRAA